MANPHLLGQLRHFLTGIMFTMRQRMLKNTIQKNNTTYQNPTTFLDTLTLYLSVLRAFRTPGFEKLMKNSMMNNPMSSQNFLAYCKRLDAFWVSADRLAGKPPFTYMEVLEILSLMDASYTIIMSVLIPNEPPLSSSFFSKFSIAYAKHWLNSTGSARSLYSYETLVLPKWSEKPQDSKAVLNHVAQGAAFIFNYCDYVKNDPKHPFTELTTLIGPEQEMSSPLQPTMVPSLSRLTASAHECIPNIYSNYHRFRACQQTISKEPWIAPVGVPQTHIPAVHKQFKDELLYLEITKQKSKAWRNASFFQRVAAIRKLAFLEALEFYENFCDTNVKTQEFASFLKKAHTNYGNACSGDILDQSMALTVRSEIPLLLTDDGVIKTEPFCDTFINQPNQQPELTDIVNILVQRFRSVIRRTEQYTGGHNRTFRLIQSYIEKLEYPTSYQILEPTIQNDEFQNALGLFWTRFREYKIVDLEKDTDEATMNTTKKFARTLLKNLKLNNAPSLTGERGPTAGGSPVTRLVITEFDGFVFFPTSAQSQAFKNRLPYVFPIPYQAEATSLLVESQSLKQAYTTLNDCQVTKQAFRHELVTRFEDSTRVFETQFLEPYLQQIEFEKIDPIWCRLAHQRGRRDLQQTLLLGPPGLKGRFFPLQNSTQTKTFADEHGLMIYLALLFHFHKKAKFGPVVRQHLQPFLKQGSWSTEQVKDIEDFLEKHGY